LAKGGRAIACPIDVADPWFIPKAFDAAEAVFGTVDILVSSAASADGNRATKLPLEPIHRVIDVDFRAPFLFAIEAARGLISATLPSRIVNISSVGAYTPVQAPLRNIARPRSGSSA
jgi:NAD(P)-dependent dehydrogenase (short-subunit alcohol dehydrogenase family)